MIPLMVLPPGPMMTRIWSGLTLIWVIRGAHFESSPRGWARVPSIFSRMCSRASRAWSSAWAMTSRDSPEILMSIWIAVMPFLVPQTLKSMSPR
jgi:hypothetical protein